METRTMRDTRDLIATEGAAAACQVIAKNPHPSLWKLLAEQALEALDLPMAEKAFVRIRDFHGVRLVNRLGSISDRIKRRAEVSAYFERHDDAEALYREIDRKDLAISHREAMGDWFRVVQVT
ncbi:unnamed protein product [Discosporangium mesarthrocarpum]